MANKMTYAVAIDSALEALASIEGMDEVSARLAELKESLAKRAGSASKAKAKKSEADEPLKAAIADVLGESESKMTVSDIIKASETLDGLSNQKVSALLRKMIEEGKVEKTMEGKKSLFSLC